MRKRRCGMREVVQEGWGTDEIGLGLRPGQCEGSNAVLDIHGNLCGGCLEAPKRRV